MTLTAEELYRRGRAQLNAGRNAAARQALLRARTRTEDPNLRARIAGSLAAITIRQGDRASAEAICLEALAWTGLSPATTAMLCGQLGLVALERGDLDKAMSLLDRGIAGIGDEVEHRAPMLLNRSVVHMQAGRLAAAIADLDRAVPDYAATGDEVSRAMAVHNRGYAALLAGDLVPALESMGEARTVLSTASAVNAAICDRDRAEVLRDAGLTRDAEHALERAIRVFGAHRMRQARAEAEFQLARSLLSHDPERAAPIAAAAARRFRAVGSESWSVRAEAVRLRALLTVEADGRATSVTPPSDGAVDRVETQLRAHRLRAEAASLRLTWQRRRAQTGPADPERESRIRVPADAPLPVRLLAQEVRAARAAASGDDARARRIAAAGLDELAGWQASFGSLDLATALVMHGAGLLYAGLGAAVRSGRPEVVFDWSERARHLSQQTVPLRPPPDPALAADLTELRMLRAEAVSGDWLAEPRAAALSEQVREREWSSIGRAGGRRRLTLAELQADLDGDTAFVAYAFQRDGLVAVAVTADDARIVDIPRWPVVRRALEGLRADLDVAATVRSGPMGDVVRRSLDERLDALSEALLAPVLPIVGDRRLALAAAAILNGVPWAMLPAMRGRVFTVTDSATQWREPREPAPFRGVGFAVGPRVPRGPEEAARGASAWPGARVLEGDEATVGAVTELTARVSVLHLAAHGRHADGNPMFSGLELADGALFGYDVDRVTPVPDTVVLSACEVGRSSVRWGWEAIGMTRVWLHAGTGSVIATPVIVADDDACELLGSVHTGLAAGLPPALALARAEERTGLRSSFQVHGRGF
ncbi:CHAT domain-containing protein [Microbacterium azadirachtae]|uniref:CHAT domain-containing protein n=1 Tax=Microbacterium azadirachtae TaxID=582680 RepID=UPI0021D511E0|nr:CHAT domain-containing protein [Microbacterium azadirachtae]UXW84933.1 CHAT domain-containing protein [Microbacterium azadirachtae]